MGAIYTQPQHLTTVDWGNPINRGLVGLFDSVKGIDLVDGGFPSTNSATQGIVSKGRIANFSNSAQIYQTKPRYAVTGALTIFTPLVVTSLANYSGILSKSSDYSIFPFELRLGSSATTSEIDFQRGGGGTASAFKGPGSLISANPRVVQYLAVRCTSGDLNVAPDVFVNKAKTTLGRNGYATITGTASDNGSALRVGNRFDTTTYLNGGIQYLALWNRALTDYEIATLSDNPWQIFKAPQRRIWVAVGGAAALAGNSAAQANAQGILTTKINIAAASISFATAGGSLTTAIPISGVAAANASTTGALSTLILMQGAAQAAATASANLTGGGGAISANAISLSTASAALSTQIKISAVAASQASASAILTTQIRISGAALAQAVSNAAMSSGIIMTASAVSQAAAQGTLVTAINLLANASAQATATASLGGGALLSASAAAQSASSADLTIQIHLAGSAAGSASASGAMTTQIPLSATALSQAIAAGGLTVSSGLTGTALTTAGAAGSLSTAIPITAAAMSLSTASGTITSGYTSNYYSMKAEIVARTAVRGTCHTRGC